MLPELLKVKEFVNADEIARGLSPFQPEKVSIEAGKIMLRRLKELLYQSEDFAFETTLSSRSFVELIKAAKSKAIPSILFTIGWTVQNWLLKGLRPEFQKEAIISPKT